MARSAPDLRPERLQVRFPGHGPMTDLGHVHRGDGERLPWSRIRRNQVSADIRGVVQAPKSDLMARGVAVDLLQMAKRVGPQCEAVKHKDLSGEKSLTLDCIAIDDHRSHQAYRQRHRGTLNESTNVGVKTGGSRVGGPKLCI